MSSGAFTPLAALGLGAAILAASPAQALERASTVERGSLIYFHKVEVKWDAVNGDPIQDTFISITNDENDGPVDFQMYFINGDAPVFDANGDILEPGWNWTDQTITLTKDQPAWWSALSGRPGPAAGGTGPVAPWALTLDPDGRECPDDPGSRCVRGYIVGWAVNDDGEEMRWNHLKGEGTIVNYRSGYAWEYPTLNFKVVKDGTSNGDPPDGTPGRLLMDGDEYAVAFDRLVLNFQAAGSRAWGDPDITEAPIPIESDTDLTLHPLSIDLNQNTIGPISTKVDVYVTNENEVQMSGNHRCITCWDQTLMSVYHLPPTDPASVNTFLRGVLQTDHGTAVIDGVAANVCNIDFDPGDGLELGDDPRDVVTVNAALAGVAARILRFDPNVTPFFGAAAASLIGKGDQAAVVVYTPTAGGGMEAHGDFPAPASGDAIADWLEREAGLEEAKPRGTRR